MCCPAVGLPGFDYKTCSVMLAIDQQSSNIAAGVHINRTAEEVGAGDQVCFFGTRPKKKNNKKHKLNNYFVGVISF